MSVRFRRITCRQDNIIPYNFSDFWLNNFLLISSIGTLKNILLSISLILIPLPSLRILGSECGAISLLYLYSRSSQNVSRCASHASSGVMLISMTVFISTSVRLSFLRLSADTNAKYSWRMTSSYKNTLDEISLLYYAVGSLLPKNSCSDTLSIFLLSHKKIRNSFDSTTNWRLKTFRFSYLTKSEILIFPICRSKTFSLCSAHGTDPKILKDLHGSATIFAVSRLKFLS